MFNFKPSTKHHQYMSKVIIAPSILAANFLELGKDIEMLNQSKAEWIHIDVMDGMFVPNISFGFPILEAVRSITAKVCDVHLMVQQPERYFTEFKKAGADAISIHYEGNIHLHRCIQEIKSLGMKAGVVLNPHTSVAVLHDILMELDYVLLMSVNPGYGGQKFIETTVEKTKELKTLLTSKGAKALIQIDGGVTPANAKALIDAGADVLVAGSAVFKSPDPLATIEQMLNS